MIEYILLIKEIQMAKILEKMSNILRCQGNVH